MTTPRDSGAARRVLVVDDNPVNLKLACDILESEGYAVDRAEDADQALVAIETAPPDLILMDIALPGMDGLTLTRKLRDEQKCVGVPIVALTAFAMKGDDAKAREAGCDGYITKPIDTRRFPAQVAEYLDRADEPARPAALHVLVIEDDEIDLKLVSLVLATAGVSVRRSVSAELAVEMILEDRPDVILLDLRLPGMDGPSFTRRLRADERVASIPVVAVTAYPEKFDPDEMAEIGCDLCIVKPIDTRELTRTLESVVRKHREPEEPRS
ncbi:MAG: response regulator [Candidatus Binatia bacterium]